MPLKMPSTLSLVSIISVGMGLIVLIVSAVYLDGALKLRKGFYENKYDESTNYCADNVMINYCTMLRNWVICGWIGITASLIQIVIGVLGIKMITNQWKVWCGGHVIVFLITIIMFSWAAKQDVDDNFEKKWPQLPSTHSKGMAFLAFSGLDFIYIFAAVIFVFVFARNESSS